MYSTMATDGDDRRAAAILWRIEKLNFYDRKFHKNEIYSPLMPIRTLNIDCCSLSLKLDYYDTCLTLYIENELNFSIDCEFSVLDAEESVLTSRRLRKSKVENFTRITMSFLTFPTYQELFRTKKSEFLPCDALRLRCRIWKSFGVLPVAEIISITSQIKVSEDCLLIGIEELKGSDSKSKSGSVSISGVSEESQDFDVVFSLSGNSPCFNFLFSVKSSSIVEPLLMTMKVSMLGDQQEPFTFADTMHTFPRSDESECWMRLLSPLEEVVGEKKVEEIFKKASHILIHFTAVHQRLQEFKESDYRISYTKCDVEKTISSPTFTEASYQTSQLSSDATHNAAIIPSSKSTDASCLTSHQSSNTTNSLQPTQNSMECLLEDFNNLFCDPTLSDFELCAEGVTFFVHKNILIARSPVFKAMFSNSMKESCSQSLDILDLDSQTLNRFLKFLYTGSIEENLQINSIAKLYYAADKYEVNSLKLDCTFLLKLRTSVSNVSDMLTLAHRHTDGELMHFAQDFIFNNLKEVMKSKEWGKFIEIDPHLAATTVRVICM